MNPIIYFLLGVWFLPLYIISWVVYWTYTYAVVLLFPVVAITHPQMFLLMVFIYVIARLIRVFFSSNPDLELTRLED